MACLLADVADGRCCLDDSLTLTADQVVGGAGVLFELESERSFTLAELCRLMMVVSDNTASNACLRQVGMERLNHFFENRGYEAEVQRYFMSPVVDGKDNRMSAESAARILSDLYRGRGLNEELREFAVGCLRRQQYREKIPLMLPPTISVGHKTGELDGVRHDAAVIETEVPYVLVLLTAEGSAPWLVDHAIATCSFRFYEARSGIFAKAGA